MTARKAKHMKYSKEKELTKFIFKLLIILLLCYYGICV